MSGTASTSHKDDSGEKYHSNNEEILSNAPEPFKKVAETTGTQSLHLDKEHALNVYCCLVEKLKEGHTAADGNPTLYLDDAGGHVRRRLRRRADSPTVCTRTSTFRACSSPPTNRTAASLP